MFDLRLLRYFKTVAETGSVTQAADVLHVSQSPLSRQIIQLETQLEIKLFDRINHRLVLSNNGKEFLERATALLASADELKSFSHDLATGHAGRLRIGYVEGAATAGYLKGIIDHVMPLASDGSTAPNLEFLPMRSRAQFDALRERRLDLALTYAAPSSVADGFKTACILDEELLLATRVGAFSITAEIQPKDLDHAPWIAFPVTLNTGLRERFMYQCAQCGFEPDIRYEAADPSVIHSLIDAGAGHAFMQTSARHSAPDTTSFFSVPWFPIRVTCYATWRSHDKSALLRNVLQNVFDLDFDGQSGS